MGLVGLWVGWSPPRSKFSLWVGLDQSFGGLSWVEEIGPTENSVLIPKRTW